MNKRDYENKMITHVQYSKQLFLQLFGMSKLQTNAAPSFENWYASPHIRKPPRIARNSSYIAYPDQSTALGCFVWNDFFVVDAVPVDFVL